jgi:hypothetical protein
MASQQLSFAQPMKLMCCHIGDAISMKMQILPDVSKSLKGAPLLNMINRGSQASY